MLRDSRFERPYKDYLIEGSPEPFAPHSNLWVAVATVLLKKDETAGKTPGSISWYPAGLR